MMSLSNICISNDLNDQKLYLKDFEDSIKLKILSEDRKNLKLHKFSSLNNHLGLYPSYRDDLESLLYIIIYFFTEGKFLSKLNVE